MKKSFTIKNIVDSKLLSMLSRESLNPSVKLHVHDGDYFRKNAIIGVATYTTKKEGVKEFKIKAPATGRFVLNKAKNIHDLIIDCYNKVDEIWEDWNKFSFVVLKDSVAKTKSVDMVLNEGNKYATVAICENIQLSLSLDGKPKVNIIAVGIKNAKKISRVIFVCKTKMVALNADDKNMLSVRSRTSQWILPIILEDLNILSRQKISKIRFEYVSGDTSEFDITEFNSAGILSYTKVFRKGVTKSGYKEQVQAQMREEQKCFVYLMRDNKNGYYKIGMSKDPKFREKTLQSEAPSITLVSCRLYPTRAIADAIESALHKVYDHRQVRGEWFRLTLKEVGEIKNTLS